MTQPDSFKDHNYLISSAQANHYNILGLIETENHKDSVLEKPPLQSSFKPIDLNDSSLEGQKKLARRANESLKNTVLRRHFLISAEEKFRHEASAAATMSFSVFDSDEIDHHMQQETLYRQQRNDVMASLAQVERVFGKHLARQQKLIEYNNIPLAGRNPSSNF